MIIEWQPNNKPAAPAKAPTSAQLELRIKRAKFLCRNAANLSSWLLADKLARLWDCEVCKALGVEQPKE